MPGFASGINNTRNSNLKLAGNAASCHHVYALIALDPGTTQRYAHLLPENQNVIDMIDGKKTTTFLQRSGFGSG
jgi:hypothetical protein